MLLLGNCISFKLARVFQIVEMEKLKVIRITIYLPRKSGNTGLGLSRVLFNSLSLSGQIWQGRVSELGICPRRQRWLHTLPFFMSLSCGCNMDLK